MKLIKLINAQYSDIRYIVIDADSIESLEDAFIGLKNEKCVVVTLKSQRSFYVSNTIEVITKKLTN